MKDCVALRRLRLKVTNTSLGNLEEFLSTTRIPHLKELYIIFDLATDYRQSSPIERADMIVSKVGAIAGTLNKPQYDGLTRVSLSFLVDFPDFDRPAFESGIEAVCVAIRERCRATALSHCTSPDTKHDDAE